MRVALIITVILLLIFAFIWLMFGKRVLVRALYYSAMAYIVVSIIDSGIKLFTSSLTEILIIIAMIYIAGLLTEKAEKYLG